MSSVHAGYWEKEIHKWLGDNVKVHVVDPKVKSSKVLMGLTFQFCIAGYSYMQTMQDQIRECAFQVVVLDEAHCIKDGKVSLSINQSFFA